MNQIILSEEDRVNLLNLLWNESLIGLAKIDSQHRFVKINQLFSDIVGYSESELIGKTWMSITHPDDVDGDLSMRESLKSNDFKAYGMSKRYLHKLGHWVPVNLKVISYFNGDTFILFLLQAVQQKVTTEKVKTEEEIIKELKKTLKNDKESLKWVVGALLGTGLTITGNITSDSITQNCGLAILATVFGGITLNKFKNG